MKYLLMFLVSGCVLVARPIDLVDPGPPYCETITTHRQICRDAAMRTWDCRVVGSGWECHRVPGA